MSPTGNRLLDCLSAPLSQGLIAASRPVDLPQRTMLSPAGEVPSFCYLLTQGAASVVVTVPGGGSAEVGMIGNEGVVGAVALLGPQGMESDTFMQIEGKGYRIPARVLRGMFLESTELRARILQFLQFQMNVTGQVSACNRLHEAEARLARWLLMASDLTQSDMLKLTQEFLAQMLGSQRTTVALVAGILQTRGLIQYSRGKVCILHREGLEKVGAECYRVTKDALQKLYQ
jgi:CRP-like cAMP-binding protein